jgi:hypothetical protein
MISSVLVILISFEYFADQLLLLQKKLILTLQQFLELGIIINQKDINNGCFLLG